MNGGDLRFHISRKAFTGEAVRFWMAELGCALRYIHTQGIVHRDVKPDNVLLDSEGHVHLADFVSIFCFGGELHILMAARTLHLILDLANN
jgi:serine/threonine protein kinase